MTLLGPGPGSRAGVSALTTLLLPSTAVILGSAGLIASRVRAATRVVALDGQVQTAYSRGLPTSRLVVRRVLHRTWPMVMSVLIVEFLALYAGSLTVQSAFTTPSLAAALPPLLPAESLPFVLGAVLLCIVGVIVVGIALGASRWSTPSSSSSSVALPSTHFRSTDFLDIRDLHLSRGPGLQRGEQLTGVSLTVTRGQALAVLGADGDGGSALCLAIAGLLPPHVTVSSGSILFDGIELVSLAESRFRHLRGHGIGFLGGPGTFGLDPGVRVGHQLARLTADGGPGSRFRGARDATALLVAVGLTEAGAVLTAYPHELPATTVQRVLLAAAVARDPQLLIADHPTNNLAADDEAAYLEVLHGLQRERGFTLILASDRVANLSGCDRVAVMHEGVIVEYAAIEELLAAPRDAHGRLLLAVDAPGIRDEPAPDS